jgi:hypothetical protein
LAATPAREIDPAAANFVQAGGRDENAVRHRGGVPSAGGDARPSPGLPTANLNMLSETSIEQICQIADEENRS